MGISVLLIMTSRGLFFLAVIIALAVLFRSGWFRCGFGRRLVGLLLRLQLEKSRYQVFRDVMLSGAGDEDWADWVVVSPHGVFVIEILSLPGQISGSPKDPAWTRKNLNRSQEFDNPLESVGRKVRAIRSLFGLSAQQVFPIVVFAGGSSFRDEMPENVTGAAGFIGCIKSRAGVVIPENKAADIASRVAEG